MPCKLSCVSAPFFCRSLIDIIVSNNFLSLSNIPADIQVYTVILIFSLNNNTRCNKLSVFSVLAIAFSKKYTNEFKEYWYISWITNNFDIRKNNIAPSSPTPLYISLFSLMSLISSSVCLELSSICNALPFVVSKLPINSLLSRIVASSASESFFNTSSSLLINSAWSSLISLI